MQRLLGQLRQHGWRTLFLLVVVGVTAVGLIALLAFAATRVTKGHRVPVTAKASPGAPVGTKRSDPTVAASASTTASTPAVVSSHHDSTAAKSARPSAVGIRIIPFVDGSRHRTLTTIVRYPAAGAAGAAPLRDATPEGGPYPLVVFGHGFAVTPDPYAPLLDAWVRAGYVVAAPIFPKSNANAPGGPDEHDLPNQPADMNFVISAMQGLSEATVGPFAGLLSPNLVAVAGQSDGGDTALAAAFEPAAHYQPINAAVILSGAEDPFVAPFQPQAGTPLLATQGTSDTINPPESTSRFFRLASPPKYLLLLDGAGHQEPYTVSGAELSAVTRVSTAFLNEYLKFEGATLRQYASQGNAGAGTEFLATP
jgi:fermentation-respiration switch protein FrsA (DUF1100 family)